MKWESLHLREQYQSCFARPASSSLLRALNSFCRMILWLYIRNMASRALLAAAVVSSALGAVTQARTTGVNSTTCNGIRYVYDELAGYGFVPSNARDKFGDTLGGLGSSLHLDKHKWKQHRNGSYSGELWLLPDRGWSVLTSS
jgi:hypothetical protein